LPFVELPPLNPVVHCAAGLCQVRAGWRRPRQASPSGGGRARKVAGCRPLLLRYPPLQARKTINLRCGRLLSRVFVRGAVGAASGLPLEDQQQIERGGKEALRLVVRSRKVNSDHRMW
jgi:hypothetical protein